jgi:trk/ktr system potassium uptake protein
VHIVIMGCGRVGSALARTLDSRGHSVAIIDRNQAAFRRLPPEFSGTTITGIGFDRDVLSEAGIESAAAFAAVSSGDNSNVISARVARETFGVPRVVARIYDPGRADVYQRLGIPTVATVKWTSDQIVRRLLQEGSEPEYRDPSGRVRISEVFVSPSWVGHRLTDIEEATDARVAFFTRLGGADLAGPDTVLQEGDMIHLAMRDEDAERIEELLAQAPDEES